MAEQLADPGPRLKAGLQRPVVADERRPAPRLVGIEGDQDPGWIDLGILLDPFLEILRMRDLPGRLLHHESEPIQRHISVVWSDTLAVPGNRRAAGPGRDGKK